MKVVHQLISGDLAGGQVIALRLAAAARAAGHDVAVVTPTPGPILEAIEAEGIETLIVKLGRSHRIDAAARLARTLRRERADVLHTHTHLAGNVLGRVAGRLAGVAVVAHMHAENAFRSGRAGRAAQVALDNATARLCARIIAVSEAVRAELVRQGYPPDRLEVVYNGVPATPAEPRRLDGIPPDAPLVLHVGRLTPTKGQRELIEAVASVPHLYAVLVGDDLEHAGAFREELERTAERLGVSDRVVFAGLRRDVPELLAGADALALPSQVEGLGLVTLEAMAQSRPVVATRVGGTPELVVDGETGLLVPRGDVDALARALAALVADREQGRRFGDAGRMRLLQRFRVEQMTARVLGIYDEVARKMPA